ncbi:hypothetical protein Avi_9878 (plasmid) [Allorhizobium ampelinum S4]|uniref:Uncharacterized protein n=1 Tax=Allorhizobium ampelinum (strain ATCC BAA-846 / DSM 112012 / S4) TaxID=311402 RepID=B9K642_ALLAM|nr:hypothetical protein Avi_9878 [Allorhizobium ampelinum S4]
MAPAKAGRNIKHLHAAAGRPLGRDLSLAFVAKVFLPCAFLAFPEAATTAFANRVRHGCFLEPEVGIKPLISSVTGKRVGAGLSHVIRVLA